MTLSPEVLTGSKNPEIPNTQHDHALRTILNPKIQPKSAENPIENRPQKKDEMSHGGCQMVRASPSKDYAFGVPSTTKPFEITHLNA